MSRGQIVVEDWEVVFNPDKDRDASVLAASEFKWVPVGMQQAAIERLEEMHFVHLTPDEVRRFGGSELLSSDGEVYLLRGVQVADPAEPTQFEDSGTLRVKVSGDTVLVIHLASRKFPFKAKRPKAVIARLNERPRTVEPSACIAFFGSVQLQKD